MNLKATREGIFKYNVDVFTVSVDGASYGTNARIRRGSDLNVIKEDLKSIVEERNRSGLKYPWINFVFCAMEANIRELPALVRLAAEIGINEVKVVYLTIFNEELLRETLWGKEGLIREVFTEAVRAGEESGIVLKLPHIPGEDVGREDYH